MNCKFGQNNNRVHPNKSLSKILEKRERGRIRGLPKFFGYPPPIISGTGKATDFKFGQYIHRVHPNKIPIISGTDKAMNFKFCNHIYRLNRNKSPLKISGKVAVGVARDSRNFS